jgi:tetratricopeptide (TPR) repeat protein
MRFIQQTRFMSGLGILLLVNSFLPLVGLVKAAELSAKAKMGGIPTVCHLERIKNIPGLKGKYQAFDRLFNRYQRAKQDSLVLQLVNGMDKKQFPQLQAEELLQVAYRYRTAAESEKAVPLLSQVFQLLQSVNDDLPSNLDTYQHIWKTSRYHPGKAQLLENLAGNLITLKQSEQAEAALLQALQIHPKQPRLTLREKVEYMVKIAKGFLALGKHEQAIALLDQSLEITQSLKTNNKDNYDNQTWLILLSKLSWEYRMAGQTGKADLLFSQSLEYTNTFSDPVKRVRWLSIIAESIYFPPSQSNLPKERQAKLEQIFGKILQILRSTDTSKMYPDTSMIAAEWFQFLGIESAMQIVNTVADPAKRFEVISPMLKSPNSEIAKRDIALLVPLLNQAEAIARTIQKPNDRDRAWGVMAFTYAQLGQSPKALEAIAQIQSVELKQKTLIGVSVYLAQAGQPDLALSLAKDLPETLVQQVLYDAFLAYLKNEQLEKALGLQGRLSQDYQDLVLTHLAENSAKVGHTTQSLLLLKQIPDAYRRAQPIISIVQQAVESGDLDRAVVFAQQMPESKNRWPEIPSKSWMLEEIAIAYAEAGEYDKALQLSQSLSDRSLSQLATCAKRSQ